MLIRSSTSFSNPNPSCRRSPQGGIPGSGNRRTEFDAYAEDGSCQPAAGVRITDCPLPTCDAPPIVAGHEFAGQRRADAFALLWASSEDRCYIRVRNGAPTHKDVKTKVDPTMYMKTQENRQNVHPKNGFLTRKCRNRPPIDVCRADIMAESAQTASLAQAFRGCRRHEILHNSRRP